MWGIYRHVFASAHPACVCMDVLGVPSLHWASVYSASHIPPVSLGNCSKVEAVAKDLWCQEKVMWSIPLPPWSKVIFLKKFYFINKGPPCGGSFSSFALTSLQPFPAQISLMKIETIKDWERQEALSIQGVPQTCTSCAEFCSIIICVLLKDNRPSGSQGQEVVIGSVLRGLFWKWDCGHPRLPGHWLHLGQPGGFYSNRM